MKILVFSHQLVIGGTPINAIDLATALRDQHGHDVVLFAAPGPLLSIVKQRGLRYLPAPEAHWHPSPARMKALRAAVRSERPDVIHVWDWFQCLDAYFSVHLAMRVPLVVTDMMMNVTRVLPKKLPTTFGTQELVDLARATGRGPLRYLPPPVDIDANAPGAVDTQAFRAQFGIDRSAFNVVTVSRLANCMKAESLMRTLEVVAALGRKLPVRFVIVGDGQARAELQAMADQTNAALGRNAVVLTGELVDPRAAYESADAVVGMGGSALRGMAFGKPVIVVGEGGFSRLLEPGTAAYFSYKGLYGIGARGAGNEALAADLSRLAASPALTKELGAFARRFVVDQYSIAKVSTELSDLFRMAASEPPSRLRAAVDGLRTATIYLRERRFRIRSIDPGQNRQTEVSPG